MASNHPRLWFITGVSSGLGRALAEAVLAEGERVVGTLRDAAGVGAFEALAPGRAFAFKLDVRDEGAVHQAVQDTEASIGQIEVLVNNAGYGFAGAIEETSLEEARKQFDVNLFGAIAAIQAVLPSMRARRHGHVVNITSVGGLLTFPGVGVYNASKFALEAISEALSQEVAHLGIRVTAVEPGPFRTDWAGRSMVHTSMHIADYAQSVGAFRASLARRNGHQVGDPRKAAKAMIQAVNAEMPPLHLVLGVGALAQVGEKIGTLVAELATWAPVSASTEFHPGE